MNAPASTITTAAPCSVGGARRRQQPEAQIQRALFQHFRARGAPGVFAFHPANGGFRRPVEAAILKGLGVRAGVPDLIACRGGRFYALELKTDTGKLSDAQEQVLAALREAGAEVAVTYGLDAALAQLECWQLLRGVASALALCNLPPDPQLAAHIKRESSTSHPIGPPNRQLSRETAIASDWRPTGNGSDIPDFLRRCP
jgi:VRR-NUC domain